MGEQKIPSGLQSLGSEEIIRDLWKKLYGGKDNLRSPSFLSVNRCISDLAIFRRCITSASLVFTL